MAAMLRQGRRLHLRDTCTLGQGINSARAIITLRATLDPAEHSARKGSGINKQPDYSGSAVDKAMGDPVQGQPLPIGSQSAEEQTDGKQSDTVKKQAAALGGLSSCPESARDHEELSAHEEGALGERTPVQRRCGPEPESGECNSWIRNVDGLALTEFLFDCSGAPGAFAEFPDAGPEALPLTCSEGAPAVLWPSNAWQLQQGVLEREPHEMPLLVATKGPGTAFIAANIQAGTTVYVLAVDTWEVHGPLTAIGRPQWRIDPQLVPWAPVQLRVSPGDMYKFRADLLPEVLLRSFRKASGKGNEHYAQVLTEEQTRRMEVLLGRARFASGIWGPAWVPMRPFRAAQQQDPPVRKKQAAQQPCSATQTPKRTMRKKRRIVLMVEKITPCLTRAEERKLLRQLYNIRWTTGHSSTAGAHAREATPSRVCLLKDYNDVLLAHRAARRRAPLRLRHRRLFMRYAAQHANAVPPPAEKIIGNLFPCLQICIPGPIRRPHGAGRRRRAARRARKVEHSGLIEGAGLCSPPCSATQGACQICCLLMLNCLMCSETDSGAMGAPAPCPPLARETTPGSAWRSLLEDCSQGEAELRWLRLVRPAHPAGQPSPTPTVPPAPAGPASGKDKVANAVQWQVSHLGERVGEAAHPGPAPGGRVSADLRESARGAPGGSAESPVGVAPEQAGRPPPIVALVTGAELAAAVARPECPFRFMAELLATDAPLPPAALHEQIGAQMAGEVESGSHRDVGSLTAYYVRHGLARAADSAIVALRRERPADPRRWLREHFERAVAAREQIAGGGGVQPSTPPRLPEVEVPTCSRGRERELATEHPAQQVAGGGECNQAQAVPLVAQLPTLAAGVPESYLRTYHVTEHLDAALAAITEQRPTDPVRALAARLAATAGFPPIPWRGRSTATNSPLSSPRSPGLQSPRAWARDGLEREQEQRARRRHSSSSHWPPHPLEPPSARSLADWAQLAAAGDSGALTAVAAHLFLPPSDVPAEHMETQPAHWETAERQQGPSPLQSLLSGLHYDEVAEASHIVREVVKGATAGQSAAAWLADARGQLLLGARTGSEQKVWRDAMLNQEVVTAGGIEIVLTPAARHAAEQVADALELQAPVLLEGPTGAGKTMISHLALRILSARRAAATRAPGPGHRMSQDPAVGGAEEPRLERFNLSASVEPEDLLFRWAADPENGGAVTYAQPFAAAAREGRVILLDEMNLAREAVLNVIESVIDHRKIAYNDPSSWGVQLSELKVHEDFRIIATQNPAGAAGYEGHRVTLSPPFLSRFRRVPLPPTERDDLVRVVCARLCAPAGTGAEAGPRASLAWRLGTALVDGHLAVSQLQCDHAVLDCITVRDLLRWAESLPPLSGSDFDSTAVAEVGWLCYCARYTDQALRLQRRDTLFAPLKAEFSDRDFSVQSLEQIDLEADSAEQSQGSDYLLQGPFALLRKRLQRALGMDRPIMLLGPPGSGKTRAVEELCRAERQHLRHCLLTANTETATLVGQYLPAKGGEVQWCDGCVSAAYQQGHAVLLDNIDAASATVCERLNPVTEFPPVWATAERNGSCRPEKADGFKIIATCSNAESLSPAFFNRFLVVAHGAIPDEVVAAIGRVTAGDIAGMSAGLLHAVRMREATRLLGVEGARWALIGDNTVPDAAPALAPEVWTAQRRRMDDLAAPMDAPPSAADSPPPTPRRVHPFQDLVRRGGALLSLGLPVLVRGRAGWGASTLAADVARQHSRNDPIVFIAHSETTVADLICSPTLDGTGAPGPLLRAWRSGRVLIIEGAERLPGGLLAEIAPALQHARAAGKVCAELTPHADQVTESKADNGFGIVAVLCTKDSLEACQDLFVELSVPDPAEAWRRADRHSAPTLYQVMAKGNGLSEQVAQAAAYLPQMTPRAFACIVKRTKVLQPIEREHKDAKGKPIGPKESDRRWADCCVSWLQPTLPPADDRGRFQRALGSVWKEYKVDERAPRIIEVKSDSGSEGRVRFAQWGLYCELAGSLESVWEVLGPPDKSLDGPDQKHPDTPVSEQAVTVPKLQKGKREVARALKGVLCSIAFAHSARQTIALVGPPSFKSFALRLFGSILGGCCAVSVQIAPGTIAQDLLGSIRPRTRQEKAGCFSPAPRHEAANAEPGACEAAPGDLRLEFEPAVVTTEAQRHRSGPCIITFEGAECASGDLLGELGVLLRERELLLEVGGIGEWQIRARRTITFCLVACPPASALCALGGIATHWCPAYGPDEQNSILADLVRGKARIVLQSSPLTSGPADAAPGADGAVAAAPPADEAGAEAVAQAVGLLAAQFAHCPLRERLRLTQLVCTLTLTEEYRVSSSSATVTPERWTECADAVRALFGPRGMVHPASALSGAPSGRRRSLSGYKGLECDGGFVRIGSSVKVRRVAMTKREQDMLKQEVTSRVHTGAPTFAANLARVCLAAQHRFPIALQGPPGTGKTLVAEQAARLLGHDFRRVQLSRGTTDADIYGSLMPARRGGRGDMDQGREALASAGARRRPSATLRGAPQGYEWTDGVISAAIREFNKDKQKRDRQRQEVSLEPGTEKKLWLCLDEFNLAPRAVLQCLLPLLSGDEVLSIPQTAEQLCIKDVVVIATFNPASIGNERQPLPHSISSCLLPVFVETMGHIEVRDILREGRIDPHGYGSGGAGREQDGELVDALMCVHEGAASVVSKRQLQHQYPINLRTLETVVQCFGPLVRGMQQGERSEQNTRFLDVMHAVYCAPHPRGDVRYGILDHVRGAAEELGAGSWRPAERCPTVAQLGWARWSPAPPAAVTEENRDVLGFLATVQPSGRAVLLYGPPATGKTTALRDFAHRCRRDLVVIPAHLFTDEGDLVGQVCVSGMRSDAYADARSAVCHQAQRVAGAAVLHAPLGSDRGAQLKRLCANLGGPVEDGMRCALAELANLADETQLALSGGAPGHRAEAGDVVLARHAQLLTTLEGHVCQLHERAAAAGLPAVSFHFVESALVHAALTGKWVLIEGIDRAPPNAIERLNPLLEAWASLDIPEREAVSRAASRPLTPEDGIHPDFRLFATASGGRSMLPASLLNRMVCVHFPALAERSGSELLGLSTVDTGDTACFVRAAEQLITLGPGAREGPLVLSEADRAARLRTLRHGIEIWAECDKQGGLRSLVFHLLAALTAEYGDAQPAAQAAAPLQGFLQELGAALDHRPAPGDGVEIAAVSVQKDTAKTDTEEGNVKKTDIGEDDEKKPALGETEPGPDAGQEKADQDKAGQAGYTGLIDGAWALRHYAGTRRADVIITEQKAALLAKEVKELWQAQPGTVLAEMLRCIRSSGPGRTGVHLRDKAAQLQEAFSQEDPGPVELFLLWWYSTEGLDVDRVCGFSVSPPKWEWVRATCGELRQIQTKLKEMSVELFRHKKHTEITACPAGYEEYVGRWLGPIVVRGSFVSLEKLIHDGDLADEEPATFTVRPSQWQDFAERKERSSRASAGGDEPVHYEQEYKRKWGDTRNVGISYCMVGAMRAAAVSAEGMTMAGSMIKSIALLAHLGWRQQGPTAMDGPTSRRLFRGIGNLPADIAEEYRALKEGDTMVFVNPSSTSEDQSAALGFVKGKPERAFFFDIMAPDHAGIQMHVSQYPGEVEILLPPFTKLVIEQVIPPGKCESGNAELVGILKKATYVRARLVGCELFDDDRAGLRRMIEQDSAEANQKLQAGDASLYELTMKSMLGQTVEVREHHPLEGAANQAVVQQCLDAFAHDTEEQWFDTSESPLVTIAELPSNSSIELDRSALERLRKCVPKGGQHAAEAPEWDERITLHCYDADLVQELASAVALLLPAGAPEQRGPPAARGSRLHIRALVRAIASRFTYRRIFVGRAQSGGQPLAAVMVLVDMAPGEGQLVLLSALLRALRGLGILPGVAVHSGCEVWCISPPGQQWTRSAGAALLGLFAAQSQFSSPLQDCSPAIHFAASVVAAAKAPAGRLLWLTQGDSGSFQAQQRHGSRRAAVLAGAQAADVEVVAICLKPEGAAAVSGNVHVSAHRAVTVGALAQLPRALRRLATGDSDPLADALRTTAAEQLAGLRVYAAGSNSHGQLGVTPEGEHTDSTGVDDTRLSPVAAAGLLPPQGAEIAEVHCGYLFVLLRTAQGDVLHAGANDRGQRGDGGADKAPHPQLSRVPLAAAAVSIVAGSAHAAAALADRSVHTWGYDASKQLGRGGDKAVPQAVPGISDAERVSAGGYCTFAHRRGGDVSAWGRNNAGQLCLGRAGENEATPQRVAALCGVPLLHLSGGMSHCIALRADGRALAWGNLNGGLADGSADWTVERGCVPIVLQIGPQLSVAVAREFCGSVGRDGALRLWGKGHAQQPAAVPLPGGAAAREVVCGGGHRGSTVFARAAGGEWAAMGAGTGPDHGLPFGPSYDVRQLRPLPETLGGCRRIVTGPTSHFALYLCAQ